MTTKPLPIRLLNQAGAALRWAGLPVPRLDPDRLEQAARKETGLHDFGPDDYREGLLHLCATIDRENRLSTLGRLIYGDAIGRALANRLLHVERMRRAPPAALQQRPLVLLGMPRTGSTLLHRVMAQLETARAPTAWELQRPHPPLKGADDRRERTAAGMARMHALAPELDHIHYVRADEPDECRILLDPSFRTLTFAVMGPVYGYLDFFLAQTDLSVPYRGWAEMLRCLAESAPDRRLTLKAPTHSGNIGAIVAAMPDACLVQTHRDPKKVVPSLASLLETFHRLTADSVDRAELGARWLAMLDTYTTRNLAGRRGADVFDVYYDDLVADPVGTARAICAHHELPFTERDAARIQAFMAERPANKHGVHQYSLADYGLTAQQVDRTFDAYLHEHGRVLEPRRAVRAVS